MREHKNHFHVKALAFFFSFSKCGCEKQEKGKQAISVDNFFSFSYKPFYASSPHVHTHLTCSLFPLRPVRNKKIYGIITSESHAKIAIVHEKHFERAAHGSSFLKKFKQESFYAVTTKDYEW